MSPDPAPSTATMWCFTCGRKVPTDSAGRILEHQDLKRRPCLMEAPYTEPAAQLIGWGLGLVLVAIVPFVLGVGNTVMGLSSDGGTGWLLLAGVLQLAGVSSLCTGIYRLARKADIAFLMSHDRYEASRAQLVPGRDTATD